MAQRHPIRIILIIAGVILLAVLIVLLINRPSTSTPPTKKTNTIPDTSNTTPKSPDQVKTNTGANGDTTPSPTGTNPNGNNSFLSQ